MSEERSQCQRFQSWLLEVGGAGEGAEAPKHVDECAACEAQWRAHRMLATTFSGVARPELSPAFDAELERRLEARVEVKRLTAWGWAAMLAYATLALLALGWLLRDVRLPAIDPFAPVVVAAALVAVPLTLTLAVAASRWMPGPTPRDLPTVAP